MLHSLNLIVDELSRQVKRYRDKRRHRREARVSAARGRRAAEAARTIEPPAEELPAMGLPAASMGLPAT
jgi:hypothetical protein